MNLQIALGVNENKEFSNNHYGDSHCFLIYEWVEDKFQFKEERINTKFNEEKHGGEKKAQHIASQLPQVPILVAKVFGPNIVKMRKKYVPVITRLDSVEKTLQKLENMFNELSRGIKKEGNKDIIYLKEE